IFPGASGSGVNGVLSANAGARAGNGGSISVTSEFQKGITLDHVSIFVNPSAGGGNGGSIALIAPNGDLTFQSDGLSADAAPGPGVGQFNGGSITLVAGGRIDIRHNHDPLTLTANSGLVGDGGSISITASDTSNAGTVEIGTGKGQIQII